LRPNRLGGCYISYNARLTLSNLDKLIFLVLGIA